MYLTRKEVMSWKAAGALRRLGIQLTGVQPRLIDFLKDRSVDCVLDVGAHVGQFARRLRSFGYTGRIISFEPIVDIYDQLVKEAAGDARWETKNMALGDYNGTATINIGSNSTLSSLLPINDEIVTPAYASAFNGREETVTIAKLDDLGIDFRRNTFLKCDTQGFERQVLEGGKATMTRLCGLQLELSVVHVYQETWTLAQAIEYMSKNCFVVSQLNPASFLVQDEVSLWEVDAVFRRFDPALDTTKLLPEAM